MNIKKGAVPVTSMDDWFAHAPPKRPDQWSADRSAMECARAWSTSAAQGLMPPEVLAVLEGHLDFGPVLAWTAEPEARLAFDDFPGEPRNTDLLVVASDGRGDYVIAVEAKADEPFDVTVTDALSNAVERRVANPRSNGVERIVRLAEKLFAERQRGELPLGRLRYQLLTATAGALAEGRRRGVDRVVLLVHEFVTSKTQDEKHAANAADLDLFVTRLSRGRISTIRPARLHGPVEVQGFPKLYIGKVVRLLRESVA